MEARKNVDVLLGGVGGQGIILASDLLCEVAMAEDYDVKKSDSLGMSQRGGSVLSHVRMGNAIFAPLIRRESADVLIAFENLEGARNAPFLKKNGAAIINNHSIPSLLMSSGKDKYPEMSEINRILNERTQHVFFLDALELARKAGNIRVENLVMLGFLSAFLPLREETWKAVIPARVPPRYLDVNLEAFSIGRVEGSRHGN